jgi:hypothetical protein
MGTGALKNKYEVCCFNTYNIFVSGYGNLILEESWNRLGARQGEA